MVLPVEVKLKSKIMTPFALLGFTSMLAMVPFPLLARVGSPILSIVSLKSADVLLISSTPTQKFGQPVVLICKQKCDLC